MFDTCISALLFSKVLFYFIFISILFKYCRDFLLLLSLTFFDLIVLSALQLKGLVENSTCTAAQCLKKFKVWRSEVFLLLTRRFVFSFAVKHLASLRQSQSPMFGVFIFYGWSEGESSCNKACSFCRSVTTLVNPRENEQSSNRKLRPLHLFSLLNVYFFTLSACHACFEVYYHGRT